MKASARAALLQKIYHRVDDPAVRAAMKAVPREEFVPRHLKSIAWQDRPLPIGQQQTISQPTLVAFMTQELRLKSGHRVLEVGTGCGYQTAVLAEIAARVFTIEVRADLSAGARERLEKLGYTNIQIRVGDGTLGWPEQAPFDAIIVTAGGRDIPPALTDQLADGGRLVIPVGPSGESQELLTVTKKNGKLETRSHFAVRFVPIVNADPNGP